jgi:hypothetical protein
MIELRFGVGGLALSVVEEVEGGMMTDLTVGGGEATGVPPRPLVNGRAFPKGAESMDAWQGAREDRGVTKSQRKSRDGGDNHAFLLTGDPSGKTITHLP